MNMEIKYERIESKEQLIALIKNLSKEDLREWENQSATAFLEALGAWLESASGAYKNLQLETDANIPSWQLFADALQAATIYE
jgi:hypothetical protein